MFPNLDKDDRAKDYEDFLNKYLRTYIKVNDPIVYPKNGGNKRNAAPKPCEPKKRGNVHVNYYENNFPPNGGSRPQVIDQLPSDGKDSVQLSLFQSTVNILLTYQYFLTCCIFPSFVITFSTVYRAVII